MRGSKLVTRSMVAIKKPSGDGEDSAEIPDEDITPELPGHAKNAPEQGVKKQVTVSRQQLEEALKKKATNLFNINKEKFELEQEELKK